MVHYFGNEECLYLPFEFHLFRFPVFIAQGFLGRNHIAVAGRNHAGFRTCPETLFSPPFAFILSTNSLAFASSKWFLL